MPNWCEGSLKLKGDPENIKRFLIERILYTDVADVPEDTIRSQIKDEEIFIDVIGWRWIKGSKRAFLTPQEIFYENDSVKNLNVSQAWGFDTETWIDISKEYNLEIKLLVLSKA